MALKNPNFYNQSSAKTLGWSPSWLNCDAFDGKLFEAIKVFQKEHKLVVDGLLGPATFKALKNDREMQFALWEKQQKEKEEKLQKKNIIIWGDTQFEIPWTKFVGLNDKGALKSSHEHCRTRVGNKIKMICLHHDAALSAHSCYDILERRNLSIHFMVDNDGTIYQSTNLLLSAQHASTLNSFSVGIEVSNALEKKYQAYYKSQGFGERPIIAKQVINGGTYRKFLGLFPIQEEALVALVKTLCANLNVPPVTPMDKENQPTMGVCGPVVNKLFEGVICHYHCNKEKWDIAGLQMDEFIKKVQK